MAPHKVTMESKAAASNLLNALHSFYQLGHLCDVTVHTEHLGVQEEFAAHRAVLAASSNYFKEIFLRDELSEKKETTVTLQDIYTEDFTTFLEFVYTAKMEIEPQKVYRMQDVAERLECKDLVEACAHLKDELLEKNPDLKVQVCQEYQFADKPRNTWTTTNSQHLDSQEVDSSSRIIATPMKNRLWDKLSKKKTLDTGQSPTEHCKQQGKAKEVTESITVIDPSTGKVKSTTYTTEEVNKEDADSGDDLGQKDDCKTDSISQTESPKTQIVIKKLHCLGDDDEMHDEFDGSESNELKKITRSVSKRMPQSYTCDKCHQIFHFLKPYQTHMNVEHDITIVIKYSCSMCSQLFSNHQNLRQHRLTVHNNERPFACSLCDKRFKRQKDINDHVRRVHEKRRTPQTCPYCDKIISSKCGLTVHIRTHTGEKPYKCQFCPASFAQRSAYNTHVRKIHESGQEKKPPFIYWKMVPQIDKSDNTADSVMDISGDRHSWDKPEDNDLVMNISNYKETCHEKEQHSTSDAEIGCNNTNEIEEEKDKGSKIAQNSSLNNKEANVKNEEDTGEDETEDLENEDDDNDNDTEYEVEDDEENSTDDDDDDNSKDEDYQNEHDPEPNYSDEDVDVKKGSKRGRSRKSNHKIKCDKCDDEFNSRKDYVVHCKDIHQSLPGKVYHCEICGKAFATHNSWKEHCACVHSDERHFACTLCNATFKRKRDVRTHYARKHEGRIKRPLCSVCGKILSSRTALVFHMRTHTGEKPYECSICHSRFAQPSQLKIHTRSHTGEKPYICEDCGACFTDKAKLNGHKRTHTGERLFGCDVCGKHFATNEYLKCHKRCHMGAKPYKCDVCGKTFGLRASLAQHSNIHAETRPYFCEQCGKTFTQQGALRRHQRIHTGEKPYKCKACERTFTDMSTLRRHVSVHDRNAHWRSYLIDLTSKKDHNWSKIETLGDVCLSDDPVPVKWMNIRTDLPVEGIQPGH